MTVTDPSVQRTVALAKANEVRYANARLAKHVRSIRGVANGRAFVANLLDDETVAGPTGAFPVGRLLMLIRGLGVVHVRWMISEAGIWSYDRLLRDVSGRQRLELARLLRGDPD